MCEASRISAEGFTVSRGGRLKSYAFLLLGVLLAPPRAEAIVTLGGFAYPKSGVQPDSAILCDTRTNEKYREAVEQGTWLWTGGLNTYANGDSAWIKIITSSKDTIAETKYVGTTGGHCVPNVIANAQSFNVRSVIAAAAESAYARCFIVGRPDSAYKRFITKTTPSNIFKTTFDATDLGYQLGDSAVIVMRLRDSSAVSAGRIERRYIDADTAQSPAILALHPGFRNVAVEAIAPVPDTVSPGSVHLLYARARNLSDLRKENVAVVMTRKRGSQTLDSAVVPGLSIEPPHFSPDTARADFPAWTAQRSDSGTNVLTFSVTLSDSVPGDNSRSETVYVRVRDAAAAGFVNPEDGDTVPPFEPETVRASIANAGNVPLETLEVRYVVTTDSAGTDTVYAARDTALNVQPGVLALSFSEPWTPQTAGKRYLLLRVATRETGGNPTNDSLLGTCFVDDGTGLASEHQGRKPKTLPTVLSAPVDLRQVEGDLYDVLGRPAKRARLGAGIYYLVTPERTRKLLVVN